jgi:hypothetical protein
VSSDPVLNIDPAFAELCLNFKQDENQSPISPTVVSDADCLTDKYRYAWTDFYPSCAPCVYKSGPAWEVRKSPEEQGIVREPRTFCCPDITPVWVSILQQIIVCLDSMGVNFNRINPFGWANKGEKELLCPFLLSVGVMPRSLDYDNAVAAAVDVKAILAKSGLPEAEVAFVEMVNKRLGGGPRLLPLDPIADSVPEYRKHFSSALGLPIAPLDTPYYEGTCALYFCLGSDTKDIALLTCAHAARPPPTSPDNNGMKRINSSQPKEYMVALGARGYTRAVSDTMAEIAKLTRDIEVWNRQLERNLPARWTKRRIGSTSWTRSTSRPPNSAPSAGPFTRRRSRFRSSRLATPRTGASSRWTPR